MRLFVSFLAGAWVGCSVGWALYPRFAPLFAQRLRAARAHRAQATYYRAPSNG